MTDLIDLIQRARRDQASGLRWNSGLSIEFRKGLQWVPSDLPPMDLYSVLSQQVDFSTLEQLDREKCLVGSLESLAVDYQILWTTSGLRGVFEWEEQLHSLSDWALPPFLTDRLQRSEGILWLYGPPRSGKTSLLRALEAEFQRGARKSVLLTDAVSAKSPQSPVLDARKIHDLKNLGLSGEILLVDSARPDVQRRAFEMALEGATVVQTLTAVSLRAAVQLWQNSQSVPQPLALLSEVFIGGIGTRLAQGLEQVVQPVTEVILGTLEVRSALSAGQAQGLVEVQAQSTDKSGMRTLNQALVQLLLKRRLELRVAFEISRDPADLDQLLKKVGF